MAKHTPLTPDETLLTPGEAAKRFGIDAKTLTRWDQEGKVPTEAVQRTLGGQRRFRLGWVEAARLGKPWPEPENN